MDAYITLLTAFYILCLGVFLYLGAKAVYLLLHHFITNPVKPKKFRYYRHPASHYDED